MMSVFAFSKYIGVHRGTALRMKKNGELVINENMIIADKSIEKLEAIGKKFNSNKKLLTHNGRYRNNKDNDKLCAYKHNDVVYFLYDKSYRIIYVGITCHINSRIARHRKTKEFHDWEIAYTNIKGLDIEGRFASILETWLIYNINPKLNISKSNPVPLDIFKITYDFVAKNSSDILTPTTTHKQTHAQIQETT